MLSVQFKIQFDLLEYKRKEHSPVAHIWVSQTLSSQFFERALNEDRTFLDFREQFELCPISSDSPSQSYVELCQAANLNIDIWSHLSNKHGETCLNQCGSVRVPIRQLLAASSTTKINITIPSWNDPNGVNKDTSVENYKGTIEISSGASFHINGQPVPIPSHQMYEFYGQIDRFKQDVFQHYIGSCVAMFKKLQSTWPATKTINAYVYNGRSGLLPAAAFLGNRTGGTDANYFLNAAKTVLAREGIPIEQFNWLADSRAPPMLGRVLTLAANLMAYVPDIVYLPSRSDRRKFLRKALESFDLARTRWGGDCEDLALEIVLEAAELSLLPKEQLSRPLSQMQQLRSMYVIAMCLGGVSSAEINGDYGQLKQMGAHMWSVMIWKPLWNHWWQAGNGKSVSAASSSSPMTEPPGGHYVLILEGTGFLQPEAARRDVSTEELAQAVIEESGSAKAFRGLRKWFFYKHGRRSRFYQTVQVLFTNEYLIEARTNPSVERFVCFAVCKPQGPLSEPTVGVEFDQFVLGRTDNVILWAEPGITENEAICVRDAMRDQHPMPPLKWPSKFNDAAGLQENSLSGALKKALGTPTCDVSSVSSGGARVVFDLEWFAKRCVVSEQRITSLIQACKESGIVCGLVSCSTEVATSELCAYRIRLRCKIPNSAELKRILQKKKQQSALEQAGTSDNDDEDEDDF